MNKIEEFYKTSGGTEYDKHNKKALKFTYYDMIGFADAYHSNQLNLTSINNSICTFEGCDKKTVDMDNLWCNKHDKDING